MADLQTLLTCHQGLVKEPIVINIIKNQQPLSSLAIVEPALNELEYVHFGILEPEHFDLVGDIPETLLKPDRVTCMDPEYYVADDWGRAQ